MAALQGTLSAAERSMRSVFVGNIPYEATEEKLKDIFSEVGPVVSFRLVYDRETGKPKGYGFCEYKDQETALSAMRNLNGYELNGRALRVDNAASEKSKEELKNLQASLGGPPVESPYGPEVPPEKAPEIISRTMASLPPEQLYELMIQMKTCIENNPNEARTLLIQNPQLSYALLQAQVLMKIITPETAASMLHVPNSPVRFFPEVTSGPILPNSQVKEIPSSVNEASHAFPSGSNPVSVNSSVNVSRSMAMPMPPRPSLLGDRPPPMAPPTGPVMGNPFPERDSRMTDHDLRPQLHIDHDMRPPTMIASDKNMGHFPMGEDHDFRAANTPFGLLENRTFNEPRYQNAPVPDIGPHRGAPFDRPRIGLPPDGRAGFDARSVTGMSPRMEDPRNANTAHAPNISPGRNAPIQNPRIGSSTSEPPLIGGASPKSSPRPGNNPLAAAVAAMAPHDHEKATLIMQVLQLTDQQIALLPPEQRQSIMILKEQLARSQQV